MSNIFLLSIRNKKFLGKEIYDTRPNIALVRGMRGDCAGDGPRLSEAWGSRGS